MSERGSALPLRGKIDDDLWLLAIEELHQEIELVVYVIGVIAIARIAIADAQREAFIFRQIATDRDDFGWIGVVEQIFRGMKPEGSAPTQHSIGLLHRPPTSTRFRQTP